MTNPIPKLGAEILARYFSNRMPEGEDPAGEASWLYARYKEEGKFPVFWMTFGADESKLRTMFQFFAAMRSILAIAPKPLVPALVERVAARLSIGVTPTPITPEMEVRSVSALQVVQFKKLGALVGPAFTCFAAGSLAIHILESPPIWSSMGVEESGSSQVFIQADSAYDFPEPDGALFFAWAEFALVAIENDIDCDFWRSVLSHLLQAEVIFGLAYGHVKDPTHRGFYSYSKCTHTPVAPSQVPPQRFGGLRKWAQFNAAATEVANQTFPSGMGAAEPCENTRFGSDAGRL